MKSLVKRFYRIIAAGLLGIAALSLNIFFVKLGESAPLPFGNVILFLVASSFGPLGAFITSTIAEVPLLILKSQDPAQCIRIIALMTSFAALCKNFPLVQPTFFLIPLWWALAGISSLFSETPIELNITQFCFDVFVFSFARTLFLSRTISAIMHDKLYRLPVRTFLPEILSIASATALGVILFSSIDGEFIINAPLAKLGGYLAVMTSLYFLIGPLLGSMLTRTLLSEYGIDLKNLINVDSVKSGFVTGPRNLLLGSENSLIENRNFNISHALNGDDDESNIALPKPIIALASDRTIVYCSDACANLLKFPESAAAYAGRQLELLPLSNEIIAQLNLLLQAASARAGGVKDEFRLVSQDSSGTEDPQIPKTKFIEIHVEASNQLDPSERPAANGFIIGFRDISDQRIIEADTLRTQKSEVLGQMSQGIAHSIADALTVIQGITFLGGSHVSSSPVSMEALQTRLQEIARVAANAGKTMQQLLEYAEDHVTGRHRCNMVDVIEQRLEFFKQSVGDAFCIELQKKVDLLEVDVDQPSVLQAVTHLLLHARDSYGVGGAFQTTGSGSITIECDNEEISTELAFIQPGARPGKYARLRIRDNGAGMSAENVSKAFDPQSGNPRLSMVFSVMRDHDGFLTTESSLGKGTSISLYFPIRPAATTAHQSVAPFDRHGSSDRAQRELLLKKALIVEDDHAVKRILELLLQQAGIETISFESGESALAAQTNADFFISDLILPGMNGVEVAKHLIARGMPGLVATGSNLSQAELPQHTLLLPKPYGSDELLATIEKLALMIAPDAEN